VCHFCGGRNLACSWDTCDGLSSAADLRRKILDVQEQISDQSVIVEAMRSGTIYLATLLLVELRSGAPIKELAADARSDPYRAHNV